MNLRFDRKQLGAIEFKGEIQKQMATTAEGSLGEAIKANNSLRQIQQLEINKSL